MQIYLQPPCIIQLETTVHMPVKKLYVLFRNSSPRINHLLGGIVFISFPIRRAFIFIKKTWGAGDDRIPGSGSYPISGFQARNQIWSKQTNLSVLILLLLKVSSRYSPNYSDIWFVLKEWQLKMPLPKNTIDVIDVIRSHSNMCR